MNWIPANAAGIAAGYAEGCHCVLHGRSLDAVVWKGGHITIVGIMSCASKADAEATMLRELENGAPLERDRNIKFKTLFGANP